LFWLTDGECDAIESRYNQLPKYLIQSANLQGFRVHVKQNGKTVNSKTFPFFMSGNGLDAISFSVGCFIKDPKFNNLTKEELKSELNGIAERTIREFKQPRKPDTKSSLASDQ
jgi:hypothetical protein